jgi:C4-dicarboxylate transporter DctM subunit
MIGIVALLLFFGLLLAGVPIVFAIGFASMVGVLLLDGANGWAVIAMQIFETLQHFPLVAIPMFLLMANLMSVGGVTNALVAFANSLVGHVRGSLAIANVTASTLFAGISGSCLADTTAVGSMMIPAMIKEGYPPAFAGAVTAAANIVGPIIPPSILMILYGFAAEVSVIKLFLAGVIPGVLISIVFGAYAYWMSRKYSYGSMAHHFALRRALRAFAYALPALVIPALIVAGVLGGVFTVTESAGAAALYALLYAIGRGAMKGAVPWREIWSAFRQTAIDTGVIMFLLGTSGLLAWVLSRSQAPQALVAMLQGFGKYETLALINLALLFLGLFLEPAPALLLSTPLLLPMVKALGIDPIHFGIILVVNLQLGVLSPPVAASAVVTSRIAGISFEKQTNALWPFMGLGVVALLLVTYIPALSLWMPNMFAR